jgi:hypothetical protein
LHSGRNQRHPSSRKGGDNLMPTEPIIIILDAVLRVLGLL